MENQSREFAKIVELRKLNFLPTSEVGRKIITKDKVDNYKLMAKFRNRIVHFYDEIGEKEIYEIIQDNLKDFEVFLQDIPTFLNELK